MQANLKEMPQLVVLAIAAVIVVLNHYKLKLIFRLFSSVLLGVFFFSLIFQTYYLILNWADPDRGLVEIEGGMVRVGMDMSGIVVGFVCSLIALIYAISHFVNNKGKTIQPENHLAIATLISSSVVFVYFELL